MNELTAQKIVQKRKNFLFLFRGLVTLLIISIPIGLYIEANTRFSFSTIGLLLALSVLLSFLYNKKQMKQINSILFDEIDVQKYLEIVCGLQDKKNKDNLFFIEKAVGNYYLGNFDTVIGLLNKVDLRKITNENKIYVYYLYSVSYLFLNRPEFTTENIKNLENFLETKKLTSKERAYDKKLLDKANIFFSVIYLKKDSTENLTNLMVTNKLFELEKSYLETINNFNLSNSNNTIKQIPDLNLEDTTCNLFYIKDAQRFSN